MTNARRLRPAALTAIATVTAWACLAASAQAAGTTVTVDTQSDPALPASQCSLRQALEFANTLTADVCAPGGGSAPVTIELPAGYYAHGLGEGDH